MGGRGALALSFFLGSAGGIERCGGTVGKGLVGGGILSGGPLNEKENSHKSDIHKLHTFGFYEPR